MRQSGQAAGASQGGREEQRREGSRRQGTEVLAQGAMHAVAQGQGRRQVQGGAGGKREGPRAGGGLSSVQRKISRGRCLYGDGEGILGLHAKERNGPDCWFGPKMFFLFLLFTKRFNKFDLNLNSTNSNSNQTTSNKTMQSCMNANRQHQLDLEKQPIFIYFY